MTKPKYIFKYIAIFVYLFLVIVHFIIKDRIYGLSTVFYAFPLPIIGVFGLIVTLLFYSRKPYFYLLFILLLGMTIYFFGHYFGAAHKDSSQKSNSHILFWNVAQSQPLPNDVIIKYIKEYKPEIVALAEAFQVSESDLNTLKIAFPQYQFKILYGSMLIGVLGNINDVQFQASEEAYKFNYIAATINQKPVYIMIADVYASPLLNKEIPLGIIHDFCKKHHVDVLIGDFNTPYESIFFKEYEFNFNSFHPYSIGMTSTWPLPIPVIEIDQIWLAKSYQPLKLEKFCHKNSDHKLLIAEYK